MILSWVCFDRAFLYLYGRRISGRDLTLTRTYSVLSTNLLSKKSSMAAERGADNLRARFTQLTAARTMY